MERIIVLQKSNLMGKRFRVTMSGFPNMAKHHHDFASDTGKTYIDHMDEKKKAAWIKRHSTNKNYNNKHSPIFFSRKLLWNEKTLARSIKKLEKQLNTKVIIKGEL